MNSVVLLVLLLLASYLGSTALGSGRRPGLATGVEWLATGFLLGPSVLAVVASDVVEPMHPVALSAIGWLALVTGLDYQRELRWRPFVVAGLAALVTGAAVAAMVYAVLPRLFPGVVAQVRIVESGALGVACSETTRHAVRWVVARHKPAGASASATVSTAGTAGASGVAGGVISTAIENGTSAAASIPLVGLGALFAFAPATGTRLALGAPTWMGVTVVLGIALGLVAAALLGRQLRTREAWTVLLGVSLLAIGLAARVGQSAMTVAFFVGLALAAVSPHRKRLRKMTEVTERIALLPVLLLAGAMLQWPARPRLLPLFVLAAAVVVARTLVHGVLALILARVWPQARSNVPLLAISFASTGALSVCAALACALAYPPAIGADVLFVVTVVVLVGEAAGPNALRLFLRRAGELEPAREAVAT
jgi:hypothetical protein